MTSHAHTLFPDSNSVAPWAEIVPNTGFMTVDDLLSLPDDGWRYEVVEGVLVRMAGSRPRAVRVTMRLLGALNTYVEAHSLGQVTPPDAVYDFERVGQPNTGLLPDIAFYTADREALVDDDRPYPFAPDLAIEVASPLQDRKSMVANARRYLRGGTRLVWLIYPHLHEIDMWHPGNIQPSQILRIGDTLDGEDVVPDFTYAVDALFA